MSNAVEKIVDTYVQLNDSRALGDLRRYRQELVVLLKAQTGLDFSLLIGQIDTEIAVIEAGLDRLRRAAHGGMSATNWYCHFISSLAVARPSGGSLRDKTVLWMRVRVVRTLGGAATRSDQVRSCQG